MCDSMVSPPTTPLAKTLKHFECSGSDDVVHAVMLPSIRARGGGPYALGMCAGNPYDPYLASWCMGMNRPCVAARHSERHKG